MKKEQPIKRVLLEISTDQTGLGFYLDRGLKTGELLVLNTALQLLEKKIEETLWDVLRGGEDDDDE